jgi:predicted Holliday junction resolvase-like endonuclease
MENLMKSDIFFFITSIAVGILTILLTIVIIYIVKIIRDIKYISGKAKTQADHISEDFDKLRENLKAQSSTAKSFFNFIGRFAKSKKSNK